MSQCSQFFLPSACVSQNQIMSINAFKIYKWYKILFAYDDNEALDYEKRSSKVVNLFECNGIRKC